jgi:hypothetical protein
MKKFFICMPHYNNWKLDAFNNYMSPRNEEYCKRHGYEYITTSPQTVNVTEVFPGKDISPGDNMMFFRWKWILDNIKNGTIKQGDIVTQFDCDVFIAQLDKEFTSDKSLVYAIDSGNTHCMGITSLRVNDFTIKFMESIICPKRYEELRWKEIPTESKGQGVIVTESFYAHDQNAVYHIFGIKPHSWIPFTELYNYGFHTLKTEHTVFTLEEILNNVEVLGPEWNTTHLVEETGNNGVPYDYDIVRTTKDRVINRHFAGGQAWRYEEWLNYSRNKYGV